MCCKYKKNITNNKFFLVNLVIFMKRCSHILLYHAVSDYSKQNNPPFLHNVRPHVFESQIRWIKDRFQIVSLDNIMTDFRGGQCAITFDDSYLSIFKSAIPFLEQMEVPYTVFINGVTVEGKRLWRDKLRKVVELGLAGDFLEESPVLTQKYGVALKTIFYQTKDSLVPSNVVDFMLDKFIYNRGIEVDVEPTLSAFGIDPSLKFISVGNRSYNNYILSSLNYKSQEREILSNKEILKNFGKKISSVFSVPNGLRQDVNDNTRKILKEAGYTGMVFSQEKTDSCSLRVDEYGLKYANRYLAPSSLFKLQKAFFLKTFGLVY